MSVINWRAHAREYRLRFKLQQERADKWMKIAMEFQKADEWAHRWKLEAKFLRGLVARHRNETEFLVSALADKTKLDPTEH